MIIIDYRSSQRVVNRGGEKSCPQRSGWKLLLDHPDVLQAVAFAVPHYPTLGEDAAAFVEIRRGDRRIAPVCLPHPAWLIIKYPVQSGAGG